MEVGVGVPMGVGVAERGLTGAAVVMTTLLLPIHSLCHRAAANGFEPQSRSQCRDLGSEAAAAALSTGFQCAGGNRSPGPGLLVSSASRFPSLCSSFCTKTRIVVVCCISLVHWIASNLILTFFLTILNRKKTRSILISLNKL